MHFSSINIIDSIQLAIKEEQYIDLTPIQEKAIPHILQGRDLIGCAQTGTGKTAAFAIPSLQLLSNKTEYRQKREIRLLILTPTRELAIQVEKSYKAYGRHTGLKSAVVFGGVNQSSQVNQLRKGTDILVATPGRLLDLINQGFISLKSIEIFILDEADRMLDMGFIHDVNKIVSMLPQNRQTLFFSATMPREIISLAGKIVKDPVRVEVTPSSSTVENISQGVYFVEKSHKTKLLVHILKDQSIKSVLVFTRTKHGADKLKKELVKNNIAAETIHGNKSQNNRQKALADFKIKSIRVLVATDIASRGIDVDDLQYVINYEIPNISETYVHRIGRTGRAGAFGTAFSFCSAEEKIWLKNIERLITMRIPVVNNSFHLN